MIDQEKIHNQCLSNNPKERIEGLRQLGGNFSKLPDKEQAWNDLIELANDENSHIGTMAAYALSYAFLDVSDKQQARDDLDRLDDEIGLYIRAATEALSSEFLGSEFLHVLDKQQAWNDLIELVPNGKGFGLWSLEATSGLGSVFPHLPNKQQAWNDLIKLISNDGNGSVRVRVPSIIGYAFLYVPDKQQAWNDLIKLISNDEYRTVRLRAASIIDYAFLYVPDKQQAWEDLHRLTHDKDFLVRSVATYALGSVFLDVPDKQQAWNDLHRLIYDEERDVTLEAIEVFGSIFPIVPDKQQAWNDLHKLTIDYRYSYLREYGYYSLGKISMFKASQVEKEEDYKKELETAIAFFEKSAQESFHLSNPAQFCLPLYRSFHMIIFENHKAGKKVNKCLKEAKKYVNYSKNRVILLEAVENLANALKQIQNLAKMDLRAKKDELNIYRQYCDRAAELMRETEEEAPYATAAMRKGLPILDRNLRGLLEEIQKKATIACKESQGTTTQEIACAVNREVQKWEISNQEEMTQMVENLAYILEEKISIQSKNQYILGKIDQMKNERNLVRQYEILAQIIPLIRNVSVVSEKTVKEGFENLQRGISNINTKLEEMIVSLKSGPKAELVISKGPNIAGFGAQIVTTIPLVEMKKYPEISTDIEKIKEDGTKLSELSKRFIDKIKGYLP